MALMESVDIPLGTRLPKFVLRDPFGVIQVSDYAIGKNGLLVVFTCNHCPYAKAVWPRLIRLGQWAHSHGINVLTVNPNITPDYPDDAPEVMLQRIKEWNIPFPYLIDDTQNVAREFKAQCTPDPYLFDGSGRLVYHGRIDDNWQDESKVKKEELRDAMQALVDGKQITGIQHPSMGCSIKWKQ